VCVSVFSCNNGDLFFNLLRSDAVRASVANYIACFVHLVVLTCCAKIFEFDSYDMQFMISSTSCNLDGLYRDH